MITSQPAAGMIFLPISTETIAASTRESLPGGKFSNLHRLIYPISVEPTFDVGLSDRRVKFVSLPRLSYPIALDGVSEFTTC